MLAQFRRCTYHSAALNKLPAHEMISCTGAHRVHVYINCIEKQNSTISCHVWLSFNWEVCVQLPLEKCMIGHFINYYWSLNIF